MSNRVELEFGDIVYASFSPSIGHEFRDKRPAIVIQSKTQLRKSNLVTLIPLTSNMRNAVADDILVSANKDNNLMTDSIAKVYYISSFDYARIDKRIGKLDAKLKKAIKSYLVKHFELGV